MLKHMNETSLTADMNLYEHMMNIKVDILVADCLFLFSFRDENGGVESERDP